MPSSLPPATTTSPPGSHALEGLGDAQFVLAAMAAGKHQRRIEAVAFGASA